MKRVTVILFMLVLSAGIVFGSGPEEETDAPADGMEPFKIGINFGFTGFMAMAATELMDAIDYYFDEIGWEVNGREIIIVREDHGSDVAKALDKAKKLVEIDKVNLMFGPIGGALTMGVAGYLQEQGVPFLSGVGSNEMLEFGGGENLFLTCGSIEHFGDVLGEYLYDELGARTLSALVTDEFTGEAIMNGTVGAFERAGGTLIQTQKATATTMDFAPYAINIKEADAVLLWLEGNGIASFVANYVRSDIETQLVIPANGICSAQMLNEIGDKAVGMIGSEIWTPRLNNDESLAFVKGYEEKYGIIPSYGWSAYVAMQVVAGAIEEAGDDISHESINSALRRIKVNTIVGDISFLPSGSIIADMRINEVKKGNDGQLGWEAIMEYEQVKLGP